MHPTLDLGDSEAWRFERASLVRSWSARPPPSCRCLRCAFFFTLATASLDSLCQHLGCSTGDSLFESWLNLLSAALPKSSEQELLKIAEENRVGAMQAQGASCVQELIGLDDGVDMMDEDDRTDLQKDSQRRNDSHSLTKDFSGALYERRQRLASSSTSAAMRSASSRSLGPERLPDGVIEQSVAKRFTPPGGYIWRGRRVGTWQAHFAPFARCSNSWAFYGERMACGVLALRHVWERWCLANGRSRSDVPIQNLFDLAGPEALTGGGASSSKGPRAP